MLTYLKINNFKQLGEVEIELGPSVVLIGPNNCGKTTALQALALWDLGLKTWCAKRNPLNSKKKTGVTITRKDLISIPILDMDLLWKNRKIRRSGLKAQNGNILISITVTGVINTQPWHCQLDFDYASDVSMYCRYVPNPHKPSSLSPHEISQAVTVDLLQPMSSVGYNEPVLTSGRINVLLGEGRTGEVLLNLCYLLSQNSSNKAFDTVHYNDSEYIDEWQKVCQSMQQLFGIELQEPVQDQYRGEITLKYIDRYGTVLDLASAGRGLQQTLFLLTCLYANLYPRPTNVLLLDEPDAHLEILRQKQLYDVITQVAKEHGNQLIIASHSEVLLEEAADRDMVIAFTGKPHRIDDRGQQVRKALNEIGFEQYYKAEQMGWVLYLEGSTDLAILQAFAHIINHPAKLVLDKIFVSYVDNNPSTARSHFRALKEAYPDLVGLALFDRLEKSLQPTPELNELMWQKRELENYLCFPQVLLTYAAATNSQGTMQACIEKIENALKVVRKDPWSDDIKASDEFLKPLFENYFEALGLDPHTMRKTNYHRLASLVPAKLINEEVVEKLDAIVAVAQRAQPRTLMD